MLMTIIVIINFCFIHWDYSSWNYKQKPGDWITSRLHRFPPSLLPAELRVTGCRGPTLWTTRSTTRMLPRSPSGRWPRSETDAENLIVLEIELICPPTCFIDQVWVPCSIVHASYNNMGTLFVTYVYQKRSVYAILQVVIHIIPPYSWYSTDTGAHMGVHWTVPRGTQVHWPVPHGTVG